MPSYGYAGDVNNSISLASAYPGGRSYGITPPAANRYRVKNNSSGEVAALNQGRYPGAAAPAPSASGQNVVAGNTQAAMPMGKPAHWWLLFGVVFVLFIVLARKFAPEATSNYGIRFNAYNAVFLTLWVVLILNLLKVAASKWNVPGLSEMILAA